MDWRLAAAVAAAGLLVGCGGETGPSDRRGGASRPAAGAPVPGGALTVDEARVSDLEGPLLVGGYVVVSATEPARLCEALAESYPPQCAGDALVLQGFDPARHEALQTAEGVTWGEVEVLGTVKGDTLLVSSTST